jgi:hypothetical protein
MKKRAIAQICTMGSNRAGGVGIKASFSRGRKGGMVECEVPLVRVWPGNTLRVQSIVHLFCEFVYIYSIYNGV